MMKLEKHLWIKVFIIFTLLVVIHGEEISEIDKICGDENPPQLPGTLPTTTAVLRGGREITANGELKVLVIFYEISRRCLEWAILARL